MRVILFLVCISCLSTVSIAQQKMQTDLLVVGASTGGTAAGIQAARMGVKTLIVEPTTWMGGMLTAAGVSCTDGNDELWSGIWMEFREALYKHYKRRNLFTGWVSETCFEPSVGDSIFKAWAAKEPQLTVQYGWYFEKALMKGKKITGALFRNKAGATLTVTARLVIDGTDLGDVYASAGAGYDVGMEDPAYAKESMAPGKFNVIQDLTWAAVLKDYGAGADKTIPRPPHYDSTLFFCSNNQTPCNGKPWNGDAHKMLDYGKLLNGKYMLNWPPHGNDYYINVIELSQLDREKALIPAREKTLGFVYFIQTQLGFKHIGLADEFPTEDKLALMPYHREGRRVKGIVRMNVNHLIKPFDQPEALYRTGISVGDYPVDHHHAAEKNAPEILFPSVPAFNVALGALIPQGIEGLIVCEKGISVSNIVNGSTRLQPCVLLTGQAGGMLAALSILNKTSPTNVSIRSVQKNLVERNVYLMPYFDIRPADKGWAAVQRIGATGIIRGTGKPEGWANKAFFYPDSTITEKELSDGLLSMYTAKQVTVSNSQKWIDTKGLATMLGSLLPADKLGELLSSPSEKPLTRREVAMLLDSLLHPFSKEIDWKGNFK